MFSSHIVAFHHVKPVKRPAEKRNAYFFGNSNSCLLIKSCYNIFDTSYSFYHKSGRQIFWIEEYHSCFTPKQSNVWRNRGRYLNIFSLLCFMLTYSKALVWFCCSFNLQSISESFLKHWLWIVLFPPKKLWHTISS